MDQHQIVAYIYVALSVLYIVTAIYLVRWVRREREQTFHDVNKLIGDAFGYQRKKRVKYFKVLSPEPEMMGEASDMEAVNMYADTDIPIAEEEVQEVTSDDECPTKTDLDPIP
jgi:hypothetical protein